LVLATENGYDHCAGVLHFAYLAVDAGAIVLFPWQWAPHRLPE
jgi:hypothetical protein